jgi:hypothetical protein
MTQTIDLLLSAVEAIKDHTLAGARVYPVIDWPTTAAHYPVIYCRVPTEEKHSLSRNGGPDFTVTATLKVCARTEVSALPNGQSAAVLLQQLAQLSQQIQVALVNNPALMGSLQQVPFIHTEMSITANGNKELGEVEVSIGLEFYQGPEDFYPLPVVPLTSLGLTADLGNVFDPTGIYVDPLFPDAALPAPRTGGPDGRPEGGLIIDLPT